MFSEVQGSVFKSFLIPEKVVDNSIQVKKLEILNTPIQKNIPSGVVVAAFGFYILEEKLKLNKLYKKKYRKALLPLRIKIPTHDQERRNIFLFKDIKPKSIHKYDKMVRETLEDKFSINSCDSLLKHKESIKLVCYLMRNNIFFKNVDVAVIPADFAQIGLSVAVVLNLSMLHFDSFDYPLVDRPILKIKNI